MARFAEPRRAALVVPGMRKQWMGALAALGVVVCVADASACHNGVEIHMVPLTRLVSDSANALTAGHDERAVRLAGRAIRRIRSQRSSTRGRLLMERSKSVLAIATVRLDGAVDRETLQVARARSAEERNDALRWAVGILEHGYSRGGGALATARYAEALARFPSQRGRAYRLLRQLHTADVVPDAQSYGVLAQLSEDAEQRAEALALCRARAGSRSAALCGARGGD